MLSTESRPGVLKHPDVQRGLHRPEVKNQPQKHTARKIIAGITAGAMITVAGIAYDQATKNGWFDNNGGIIPGTTDTTDEGESTLTSSETTNTSETTYTSESTSESIIIPTKPSTETTSGSTIEITTTQTTEVTTETTTEATMPTTRETTTTSTTKPTTEITTTIPTTTETKSELDGIPAERLQFVKDLLKIYENSLLPDTHKAFNKVDDYLTREQIINYGKTGEYSNIENFSIINHKDGKPALALINCRDNVVFGFKKAISEMEAYDPNYLKIITDNGMRSFIVNRFNVDKPSTYTFNNLGQVVWNATEEKISRSDVAFALKNSILTEAFGIKFLNLGGDYAEYVGYFKQGVSAYCWWHIYKENGQQYCEDMAYGSYMGAIDLYENNYYSPVTFKSEKIQNLFDEIFDKNLVAFFGGTANQINQDRDSMPDWKPGDIQ